MYPRRSKSRDMDLTIGSCGEPAITVLASVSFPARTQLINIPTISFRAPFPALLAFLRFPLNVLFPRYKTHVVPTNAKAAALNARFEITQSCTRPVNDRVGTTSTAFRDGRTDEGIQDCCDSESRRVVAALSTCRSMEFATWSEYRFTSWGIDASWKS